MLIHFRALCRGEFFLPKKKIVRKSITRSTLRVYALATIACTECTRSEPINAVYSAFDLQQDESPLTLSTTAAMVEEEEGEEG